MRCPAPPTISRRPSEVGTERIDLHHPAERVRFVAVVRGRIRAGACQRTQRDEVREVARDGRQVVDLPLRHQLLGARAVRIDDLTLRALGQHVDSFERDRLRCQREIDLQVLPQRQPDARLL